MEGLGVSANAAQRNMLGVFEMPLVNNMGARRTLRWTAGKRSGAVSFLLGEVAWGDWSGDAAMATTIHGEESR